MRPRWWIFASVAHRTEKKDCRIYGFRFTKSEQIENHLLPVLSRLFNQRQTYRVKPTLDAPVNITLVEGGNTISQVRVVDISDTDVGLRIPPDAERLLAEATRVKLSISLPNCGDSLHLNGLIGSRRLADTEIHYGIEFDLERSPHAEGQRRIILAYVMQRQRQICRRRRD